MTDEVLTIAKFLEIIQDFPRDLEIQCMIENLPAPVRFKGASVSQYNDGKKLLTLFIGSPALAYWMKAAEEWEKIQNGEPSAEDQVVN